MNLLVRKVALLPWRKLVSFSLLQLAGAIVPLLVLPMATHIVGAEGWVALSLGYSIGGVVALVINFGWTLRGPGLVAGEESLSAARVYWESFCFRLLISVPLLVVGGIFSVVLSPEPYRYLAAMMAVAMGLTGLGATWFFIGRARPGLIALTDVGPKVVASIAVVPLLWLTGAAWLYPGLLLLAALVGPMIANRIILGKFWLPWPQRINLMSHGRAQFSVVLSGLVLAGYGAFSVPLATLSAATVMAVASFAAAVRLRSIVQAGIAAVSSGFQGWAIEKVDGRRRPKRMIVALVANTFAGLLAGASFAVLAPIVTPIMLGPEVHLSSLAALHAGGSCLLYAMSASLSYHILAPLGRLRWIAVSTTVASIVGVPLILVMTAQSGAEGATLAVMIAELVVVVLQLPVAIRELRHALRLSNIGGKMQDVP